MRKFNATEKVAFEYFNTRPGVITGKPKMWRLYYSNEPLPRFEHTNYGYCRAEIKRLLVNGTGFKKDLFKIK